MTSLSLVMNYSWTATGQSCARPYVVDTGELLLYRVDLLLWRTWGWLAIRDEMRR